MLLVWARLEIRGLETQFEGLVPQFERVETQFEGLKIQFGWGMNNYASELVFYIWKVFLPLNSSLGIIRLSLQKCYIHWATNFFSNRGVTFITFLFEGQSKNIHFYGLGIKFALILIGYVNKHKTSKHLGRKKW